MASANERSSATKAKRLAAINIYLIFLKQHKVRTMLLRGKHGSEGNSCQAKRGFTVVLEDVSRQSQLVINCRSSQNDSDRLRQFRRCSQLATNNYFSMPTFRA